MKIKNYAVMICLTVAVNVLVTPVSAQQLPAILTATKFEKGIYKDLREFLSNKPSITDEFQIIPLSGQGKLERGTADFKLVLLDSTIRRKDGKKIWGACDGESIYVNEAQYSGSLNLKIMHGVGRYCYFKGSPPQKNLQDGGVPIATAIINDIDVPYILNINNGNFFVLDKNLLRVILKRDQELLNLFEDSKRKDSPEVLLHFIREYNSRHVDEAFIDIFDPIEVIFYGRDKKNINDQFIIQIGDSTQVEINGYDFERYFSKSDTLRFCVNDHCSKIALTKKRVNYIECRRDKKNDAPELIKVDRETGEYHHKVIEAAVSKKK